MTVLALTWELSIPGCRSLKAKRGVIRSLVDRLRNRFNVSVAETDLQDVHDRSVITVALVASDGRLAESLASRLDSFVDDDPGVVILGTTRDSL